MRVEPLSCAPAARQLQRRTRLPRTPLSAGSLHRGERDRFLRLIDDYFWSLGEECALVGPMLERFEASLEVIVDGLGVCQEGDALAAPRRSCSTRERRMRRTARIY